jgi:hypothetical protein
MIYAIISKLPLGFQHEMTKIVDNYESQLMRAH